MTKRGLSYATENRIVQIVAQHAVQGRWCSTSQIYTSLYGTVYAPTCSSLRVTLSWLVRQGMLRRQRDGRSSSFYPVSTREEHWVSREAL